MTVARGVNGAPNVRDSTRRRVLEAIEQLKYSPNTAARSLAAGSATHIGLFYANPSDAYLTQFLVGALDGAARSPSSAPSMSSSAVGSISWLSIRPRTSRRLCGSRMKIGRAHV